MLSRKAKYALIAALDLAENFDRGPRLIVDICNKNKLPRKFVESILLELKNAGLLDSKKGRGGGYILDRSPETITVGEVVRKIDGPLAPFRCASAQSPVPCEECLDPQSCGIRSVMKEARDAIAGVLDKVTLAEANRRSAALSRDRREAIMYHI
ncbi:MAG: Rrf2 family transcriptional regulator [Candidatus Sumerlaeia bacterium]|nr:Rrf2 family transcriptional regulator [Candidatus Sumerlaeia bacterium]